MEYCKKCLMPDTRPGLKFYDGVCYACIHYEKQKETDWTKRWRELELMCDKYRGSNGNSYDCAIAVSGGKDSHYQTHIIKDKLKMNPLLLSVGNFDWTNTGRKNLDNLSDAFGCDTILLQPNRKLGRIMLKKAFEEIGSPMWYPDALIYSFPVKMCMKLGIKFLIYGEDINYIYGGEFDTETPSAMLQSKNDVVKPMWDIWFKDKQIDEKELEMAKQPDIDELKKFGLDPIYLSYFVPWNSYKNYKLATQFGFQTLENEYERAGSIDNYDQIDSLPYLLNPYLKYPKYGHSVATDNASRLIRYGMKTREEMIPIIEEKDGKLDQGIVKKFLEFTGMDEKEFFNILDKWYNPELFERDDSGIWTPKFKVGSGLIK